MYRVGQQRDCLQAPADRGQKLCPRERVLRHAGEKPTSGVIVCESAGRDEVRYALAGLEERVFVAAYQVRLPTEETIKERLEEFADSAGQDEEGV